MGIITRDELKELIDSKGDYVLIDVRDRQELTNGFIPTAHCVPLNEIEEALGIVLVIGAMSWLKRPSQCRNLQTK